VASGLAIGVVGRDRQPPIAAGEEEHRLGLARALGAERLDGGRLREQARADAVVQRHARWPRHTDGFKLFDVVFDGGGVAAGPAGDDQLARRDRQQLRGTGAVAHHGFAGEGKGQ
jgi:hypothetical protein